MLKNKMLHILSLLKTILKNPSQPKLIRQTRHLSDGNKDKQIERKLKKIMKSNIKKHQP